MQRSFMHQVRLRCTRPRGEITGSSASRSFPAWMPEQAVILRRFILQLTDAGYDTAFGSLLKGFYFVGRIYTTKYGGE